MRPRMCLFLGLAVVLFATIGLAQGHGRAVPHAGKASSVAQASRASSPSYRHAGEWSHARSPYFNRGIGFTSASYWPYSGYTFSPYGLQSYGWPYFGAGNYGFPYAYAPQYNYSDYFPYLYFFDLYNREAQQSKEEADQFEASFAGQKPASSASPRSAEAAPLSPREVVVIIDGQPLPPSAAGYPLAVGSGHHTVRIAAKPAAPAEKGTQN
jgi:hypothetical protein